MIAVDTNLLVHAHRTDAPEHRAARVAIERLALSGEPWAIPVPCATEFVAVVTRRVRGVEPSPTAVALDALDGWLAHPACRLIVETADFASLFRALVERASLVGPDVYDARIAAICIGNGVRELWSSDRGFSRFPDLRTRDPLVPSLHEPVVPAWRLDQPAVPSKRSTPSSSEPRPMVRRSRR